MKASLDAMSFFNQNCNSMINAHRAWNRRGEDEREENHAGNLVIWYSGLFSVVNFSVQRRRRSSRGTMSIEFECVSI